MKKIFLSIITIFTLCFCFTNCYSVFSGGTGGQIVDAESSSSPKTGIANVDVYAYTSSQERDNDFNKWIEGTKFNPNASYYGHTTTGTDGNFVISKIVWKSGNPDFGKDADYTQIYFLFYHENYGLTKSSSVIISDSTSQTVYAELTKVKKTTELTLNFQDVSTGINTTEQVYVEIFVPQTTENVTDAEPKKYEADITNGTGIISVSYPRWQNETNRTKGIETEPEITINYKQNTSVITWKGSYNGDSENKDYAFRTNENNETIVKQKITGQRFNLTLYGKKVKLNVPVFNGQWGNVNGITLRLLRSTDGGSTYSEDCGSVETEAVTLGTEGKEKNGCFDNLGSGKYWFDNSYTGKNSTGYFKIAVSNGEAVTKEVSTERNRVTIQKD